MSDFMALCQNSAPIIMGIVNATPDSFSDGGDYNAPEQAAERGFQMIMQGAGILDIGGESTRPNAEIVSVDEEIRRVVPVIERWRGKVAHISIDTRNAETMRAAIKVGANFINDVSGLEHDPESVNVVAGSGLPVCIMHMRGTPQDMQSRTDYDDVVDDVFSYFEHRLEFCARNGVDARNVILDPGIGFGKTVEQNLALIRHIDRFHALGCPILLGVSRKSFIGAINEAQNPKDRLAGSLAAALYGLQKGVQIFRVHDVFETAQAFKTYSAIAES